MGVRLELEGLGIDDAPPSGVQRRYAIDIVYSTKPEVVDTMELDVLLGAWYTIGCHGGLGAFLNHPEAPVHEEAADGWHTKYAVVGIVTHHAIAVLLRCLDVSDIDLIFERMVIDVTPYD